MRLVVPHFLCLESSFQKLKGLTDVRASLLYVKVGVGFICLNGVSISAKDNGLKLLLPIGAMITLAFSIYLWRKCSVGIVPIKYMTYMHSWDAMFTIPTVLALRQINISNGSFTPSPRQIFL